MCKSEERGNISESEIYWYGQLGLGGYLPRSYNAPLALSLHCKRRYDSCYVKIARSLVCHRPSNIVIMSEKLYVVVCSRVMRLITRVQNSRNPREEEQSL